jgi:hypothetical protein
MEPQMREEKTTTEKKTVTMRSQVIERLEQVAREENRNFSNMVETAALSYLKDKYNYGL